MSGPIKGYPSKNSDPSQAKTITATDVGATKTGLDVVVIESALPTGGATAANQATQITQLTSIFGRQADGTQKTQLVTPTPLTVKQAAVSVGTTAVRLTTDGSAPSASRVILMAQPDPNATANFWVGSSTVTATGATRGVQLAAGEKFIANNDAGDYYIISDTAAQTVFILEQE